MNPSSDNSQRRADTAFVHRGQGMQIRFRCGQCNQPNPSKGCGIRAVMGLRTKVCEKCKGVIDARKKKAAKIVGCNLLGVCSMPRCPDCPDMGKPE